jgi:hypothetical protein
MDPGLDHLLRTQSVDAVLEAPPSPQTLKSVDFSRVVLPDSIDTHLYEILLSPEVSAGNVALLFPNNARCPLLWSSGFRSLHKWNAAINEALSNSLDELDDHSPKLCIVYGKHIYKCHRVSGKVYVFWAMVRKGSLGLMGMQMPVLINTDGKLEIRAVMPFHYMINDPTDAERIPLTAESPKVSWNWKLMGGHPFICDERHERAAAPYGMGPAPLSMSSESNAHYHMTRNMAAVHLERMQARPLLGHNQFEQSVEREEEGSDSGVTIYIDSASDDPEGGGGGGMLRLQPDIK